MIRKIAQWFYLSITNTSNFKNYFHPFTRLFYKSRCDNTYVAKLIRVRHETLDVYTLILKPSIKWPNFLAGQFIELTLEVNGSLLTRVFSVSSAPWMYVEKGLIEITIQMQKQGRVTPHLPDILNVGQRINISIAKGDFELAEESGPLLFIAGGTGITPIRSMISHLSKQTEINKQEIQLIYYAHDDQHLFKNELRAYENDNPTLKISFINTSTQARINTTQLQNLCADCQSRTVLICGPTQMIETTISILQENGLNQEQIHYEYFGAPPVYDLNVENQGEVSFLQSLLKLNTTKASKQTLLEIAESSGLKPAHGCRMGVCHQCICQKKKGVIYNTLTQTFSDNGAQEIQMCVSVPIGDVILDL